MKSSFSEKAVIQSGEGLVLDKPSLRAREFKLLKKIGSIFKEPPFKPEIKDSKVVKSKYTFWRVSIFLSIYVMYFVSYLSRKNLAAATPFMIKDLHITKTDLGILGSVFYITYGIGKFVNGVLADKSNVKVFLPLSVLLAGLASAGVAFCTCFVSGTTANSIHILIMLMAICWGLNGWFQSAAFPLCGKSLTFWFSNKERDIKWSWWSTSHEFGGSAALLLTIPMIASFGWKGAFYVPAFISAIVCIIAFFALQDKPQTIGLPDVEEYHHTKKSEEVARSEAEEDNMTYGQALRKHVLSNKNMWLLGAAFVFVYILRMGPLDWMIQYFVEVNGNSFEMAVLKACMLPLVGSIGTLTIPYVSDKLFAKRRAPANFSYLMLAALALLAFKFEADISRTLAPFFGMGNSVRGFSTILQFVLLALIGIATCGPLVLIGGLCSVEASSKKVAAASTGFTGAAGYIGAICASFFSGYLADSFGFSATVYFWMFSALAGALLCIPLWNTRSRLS